MDGKRYVLVCRGPTCKSQGSVEVRECLRQAIERTQRNDVVVLPYTCFDLCGRGPNAVVYPDGIWYEALRVEDVPDVVAHVLGGQPATHLLGEITDEHAQQCYEVFDEVIPELEEEERRKRRNSSSSGLFGFRKLFRKGS